MILSHLLFVTVFYRIAFVLATGTRWRSGPLLATRSGTAESEHHAQQIAYMKRFGIQPRTGPTVMPSSVTHASPSPLPRTFLTPSPSLDLNAFLTPTTPHPATSSPTTLSPTTFPASSTPPPFAPGRTPGPGVFPTSSTPPSFSPGPTLEP